MSASTLRPCERSADGEPCCRIALRWVVGTCGIHATPDEIDAYLRIDMSARSHPSAA
jgi:hypothetical protein